MSNACERFWGALSSAMQSLGQRASRPPAQPVHDPDGFEGQATSAQTAASESATAGGDAGTQSVTGTCPVCKVAIMIGHNSRAQGATSLGISEYEYNSDIAERTLAKISEQAGGRVSCEIFRRTSGSNEFSRAYAPLNAYLADVSSDKRIALELHYNSAGAESARRVEMLYKGDVGVAQRLATGCAAIFGGEARVILLREHVENTRRGGGTLNNGPTNTVLTEPFFGSNPASRAIALTEEGKDGLAQVYADALVSFIT